MNAQANIQPEWTAQEQAYRASITVHCAGENELKLRARVELAKIRDRASAALGRCSDASHAVLADVARQATFAVLSRAETRALEMKRIALAFALDAAWALEVAARDNGAG